MSYGTSGSKKKAYEPPPVTSSAPKRFKPGKSGKAKDYGNQLESSESEKSDE